MPTHAEKRLLPYTPEQLYEVVADVDRYPEFLPWCKAARVTRRDGDSFEADLVIAFKMFRERFSSRVQLVPKTAVDVQYVDGPFRYLNNHWRFLPAPGGGCIVDSTSTSSSARRCSRP
jgi:coenzyme Q-binding protein COQ10